MSIPQVENPLVLFDGVCALCNGSVRFIIERDPDAIFKFSPLQSDTAKKILSNFEPGDSEEGSIILLQNGVRYTKSTAALRILLRLNALWPILYIFILIPRPLRDYFYDIVAKHRYKWFGKSEQCMVPDLELKDRFVE